MTFKKPYRICNKAVLEMQDRSEIITATLKATKRQYELRIRIPNAKKCQYSVAITRGMLYIYEGTDTMSGNSRVLGCFLLPANVQQNKVQAFYRNYGLKILMPIMPHDEITLQVPVLRESPRTK